MGNYKLFNNRFVSVRSLCNQSNVQLNFVRLAKWEISFGEFCYIQMAFVRWTGILFFNQKQNFLVDFIKLVKIMEQNGIFYFWSCFVSL